MGARVAGGGGKPDWKGKLALLLKGHGRLGAKTERRLSSGTLEKRSAILFMCFEQLHDLGYKVYDPTHFRGKHFQALVAKWEEEGLSPSTLQNRISILRVFAGWIGKTGMIGESELYVKDKSRVKRKTATERDKSWQGAGINVEKLLAAVAKKDVRVGLQLRLMHAFGARMVEAIAFKPHIRDHGVMVEFLDQTKGGQRRSVPILEEYQRQVLEECKAFVRGIDSHMGRPGKTLKQEVRHFNHVMESMGITGKDLGVTSHGLRHGFLNDYFEKLAGVPSPVRQLGAQERQAAAAGMVAPAPIVQAGDPEAVRIARHKTSEAAGHIRPSITTAYTGSVQSVKRGPGRQAKDDVHIPKRNDAQPDLFLGGNGDTGTAGKRKPRKSTAMDWSAGKKKTDEPGQGSA